MFATMMQSQKGVIMRFNNMDPNQQQNIISIILRHDEVLRTIFLGSIERIIKALFLVNAGGLITLLAYLYKDHVTMNARVLFNTSLNWFLFGFIFAFIVVISDYLSLLFRTKNYNKQTSQFLSKKQLEFEKIDEFKAKSFWREFINWAVIVIGTISFVFAVIGVYYGYLGFIANSI